MPVSNQNLKPNDLLAKSQIRTMKKDLKRLREGDVAKESKRILEAPVAPVGSEAQKQKTFLLQKEQVKLKTQLESTSKEQERIASEKEVAEKEAERLKKQMEPLAQKGTEGEKLWSVERKEAQASGALGEVIARQEEAKKEEANISQQLSAVEESLKMPPPPPEKPAVKPTPPPPPPPKPTPASTPQKPTAIQTPAVAKEKDQRKKFLEEVEAWANSNKSQ